MYLYLSINYKNSFENIRTDVKIGDFPILIAYWSGFGTFKKNRENPNEIGMVEQKTKQNKTKQQILLKIGK